MKPLPLVAFLGGWVVLSAWGKKSKAWRRTLLRNAKEKAQEEQAKAHRSPSGVPLPHDTFYPFVFEAEDSSPWYDKAIKEYAAYYDWSLPAETYPYTWEAGSDYAIIKIDPGHWVEVTDDKSLWDTFVDYLPSWTTVAFSALGITLMIAPEILAAYGIAGAAVDAVQAATMAYRAAAVIRKSCESTGAGIAEVAAQTFLISRPGTHEFMTMLVRQLEAYGIRVVVKEMETL